MAYLLVHPRFVAAIGLFDTKHSAANFKGRHPEFKAAKIVPFWAESEAVWINQHTDVGQAKQSK